MARWLLKGDPADYGFDDLARDGEAIWDGIRNPLALQHLRSARRGDEAIIYHSGGISSAIGLATIVADPFPDPRAPAGAPNPPHVLRIKAGSRLARPVTLAEMKGNPALRGFDLLRLGRLSVVPVSQAHWREILKMSRSRR